MAVTITADCKHTCVLLETVVSSAGEAMGDVGACGGDEGEIGNELPLVNLGPGVRTAAVVAGGYHTCALLVTDLARWGLPCQAWVKALAVVVVNAQRPWLLGTPLEFCYSLL